MWRLKILNPIDGGLLYEREDITLTKIYKKFKKDYPDSKFINISKMRNIFGGRNKKDRDIIKIEKFTLD